MYKLLLYLTNNLDRSTHEKEWDVGFFVVMFLLSIGATLKLWVDEPGWVFLGWMWFIQAVDQIRHNREDI